MGIFDFGGSTSSSTSQSDSMNQSDSASSSGGFSAAESEQSVAFEDIFARMFGGAEGAAGGLDPSMLTGAANSLFSSGSGFMQGISGNQGNAYLQDRLSGDNEAMQGQIDMLGQDLGNFFNQELMPGIASESIQGGQLGGGRQGVAQGKAISEMGNQFTRGATELRAGDVAARDQAAMSLSGNAVSGAMAGFQGMGAMAGIADMGFNAGMAPYERLAAIMGGPTVLGSSSSNSADWASAWSESFGQSSATSESESRAISLGMDS